MDAAASAADLHTLLGAAGLAPPYVLAGHSYGGMVVRMFRDQHPDEVAGMVLADASHPGQWAAIPASRAQVEAAVGPGDLPLVVLSVTEQARYGEVLTRLQADLATLSTNSRHTTVAGATHYTLVSERAYAAVVADAVRTVIDDARRPGVAGDAALDTRRSLP